jgi:hypothetical protein
MAFFLQSVPLQVVAHPTQDFMRVARRDTPTISMDEPSGRRTLIIIFCIAYGFLLALAQGRLSLLVFPTCVANTLKVIVQVAWPVERPVYSSPTF